MDDGRRGDAPSVRGTKNGPGAVWQIQYTSRNLLVDDFKNLGLLMPVPEAKQFKTDEAKTQSIVCNTLFLENQGFLDEQDSAKRVSNAIKTSLTFYTKTDEAIASPNQTAITRRLTARRQALSSCHGPWMLVIALRSHRRSTPRPAMH
ncbi:hypothetical protein E4U56_007223 [Claviceps arundinis]|uniref:Uncharacterized protein n=1 Tax=Claviceps arundinis TaxID=1623583 RepID=A0A9P7MU42_9HYPO|nr:hypothetical protein E4U56_007223 [Claviceps arundinis]